VLGSRPTAGTVDGAEVPAASFFIDPASGTETPIAGSDWRPVVDRNGTWSVAWSGTVRPAADGVTTVPATGALVLRRFDPDGTGETSATPPPAISTGPFSDFDARWDETGTWLAIWLADPDASATFGRLTLLHVDRETGALDRPNGAPQDVPALPGFSISDGRLAWATPPGQGGEGSRIQIVAWTDKTVGAVESVPVTDVVVVH
jgi:hypothetical protein